MKSYTLYEFVGLVEKIAHAHPSVNTFCEGVYQLDAGKNIRYPVLALTISSINYGEQTSDFVFNLVYADRLTKERDNRLQIQSVGTEVLRECVNALKNNFDMDSSEYLSIRPFTGQFADDCAGTSSEGLRVSCPSNINFCDWLETIEECNE